MHSSSKAARDAAARAARIEAGLAAIDAVAARLAGPKSRIKTQVTAEQTATAALQAAAAARWVGYRCHVFTAATSTRPPRHDLTTVVPHTLVRTARVRAATRRCTS
ncbi:hypothetical protein [Georgenia yuyongxinii]